MNDTEQNKALAEWLGWTELRVVLGDLKGVPPTDWKGYTDSAGQAWVPDFGRDLISVCAAIPRIPYGKQPTYMRCLFYILVKIAEDGSVSDFDKHLATAAQRREALLRTLNIYKP